MSASPGDAVGTVTVRLDAAARREALLAGADARAEQDLALPRVYAPLAIELGAPVDRDGQVRLVTPWLSRRPANVEDALTMVRAQRESEREGCRARAAEVTARIKAALAEGPDGRSPLALTHEEHALLTPELRDLVRDMIRARSANAQRRRAERILELVVFALDAEDAEDAPSDEFYARLRTPGPTALGGLSEQEAMEIVRAHRLPVGGDLREYVRLTDEDARVACRREDPRTCLVDFGSGGAAGLTRPELRAASEIRRALAARGLAGETRLHTGWCSCTHAAAPARRVGVLVALDLGEGVQVRREYG